MTQRTNNPLSIGHPGDPRRQQADLENIQAHCDALNALSWVRRSGQPYFVNRSGGSSFLDRKPRATE